MSGQCENRCKPDPLPAGFPVEKAAGHPSYRYLLEPGAQCEHDAGHDGAHRSGGLSWWDPQRFQTVGAVDEQPRTPITNGWTCPDCQRENPPEAVFCRACASTLQDDREPVVTRPDARLNEDAFPEGY